MTRFGMLPSDAPGQVVCWGDDGYGQATPPDAVSGVSGTASAIAAGAFHSCAIQAGTGDMVCWSREEEGQTTTPDVVDGASGSASAISAGEDQTLAISHLPEPATALLHATALTGLAALERLRRRSSRPSQGR